MVLTGNSNKQEVYKQLYAKIVNAKYVPGQKISEKDLSEEYHIGRTPLREIIMQLKLDGLVETVPQSGTYITKINLKFATNARFVRESIETRIIREAAVKITPSQVIDVESIVSKQRILLGNDDFYQEFMQLDNDFHAMFYKIVDKGEIWDWIGQISPQLLRFRNLRLLDKQFSWEKLVDDHEKIAEAVKKHDLEEASHLVENHTHLMLDEKVGLMAEFPSYFVE